MKLFKPHSDEIASYLWKNHSSQLLQLPEPNFVKSLGYMPTKKQADLGRLLFNDTILSRNNDVSCATCHLANHGFATGNSLDFGSLGHGGPNGDNVGKEWAKGKLSTNRSCGDDSFGFKCRGPMFRNSISPLNVVYRTNIRENSGLLWDGRFGTLSFQVLLPLHTVEEMCGSNPIPFSVEHPFHKNGKIFDQQVKITNSFIENRYNGRQTDLFNSLGAVVDGLGKFRKNNTLIYPTRNECLALAVAKVRSIPKYRKLFKKVYDSDVTDVLIGKSLGSFVASMVSNNSSYDQFVKGDSKALSTEELKGLLSFITPLGKISKIGDLKVTGAGCISCHAPPFFGGDKFSSIGVMSDFKSSLSQPNLVFSPNNGGFFSKVPGERGLIPSCIVQDQTSDGKYSPDVGRAHASFKREDCFKFRVPILRNVIETYPYFHHGTARGQGYLNDNFKNVSEAGLKQAISYHLMGKQNWIQKNTDIHKRYQPPHLQMDFWVPIEKNELPFIEAPLMDVLYVRKILSNEEFENLFQFVAFGLLDKKSSKIGYFKNSLSHPKTVPSGFSPSITRDHGHQLELPPNYQID